MSGAMRLNKLWQWQDGQHGTGYQVFTLAWVMNKILPFDSYIIRYPPGSSIPPHRDVLKNKKSKHFRLNLILTHPEGGEFKTENAIIQTIWLNLFRPDLSTHSVTTVTGNRTRYVWSIGWTWKW